MQSFDSHARTRLAWHSKRSINNRLKPSTTSVGFRGFQVFSKRRGFRQFGFRAFRVQGLRCRFLSGRGFQGSGCRDSKIQLFRTMSTQLRYAMVCMCLHGTYTFIQHKGPTSLEGIFLKSGFSALSVWRARFQELADSGRRATFSLGKKSLKIRLLSLDRTSASLCGRRSKPPQLRSRFLSISAPSRHSRECKSTYMPTSSRGFII